MFCTCYTIVFYFWSALRKQFGKTVDDANSGIYNDSITHNGISDNYYWHWSDQRKEKR